MNFLSLFICAIASLSLSLCCKQKAVRRMSVESKWIDPWQSCCLDAKKLGTWGQLAWYSKLRAKEMRQVSWDNENRWYRTIFEIVMRMDSPDWRERVSYPPHNKLPVKRTLEWPNGPTQNLVESVMFNTIKIISSWKETKLCRRRSM